MTYSFTLADLEYLTTNAGEILLARLASEDLSDANALPLLTRLRRDYSAEQAGAALELGRLRLKAVEKFGAAAARMFFTRDALEQASDPLIRRWRAAPFARTPLLDVCSGIGADALAFGAMGCPVTGIEIDPVRAQMARMNAAALGIEAQFVTADARGDLRAWLEACACWFYDPARRDTAGKRLHSVEAYQPPLSLARVWHAYGWSGLIKLSPAVALDELRAYYGGLVQFVSVDGDLKEADLWLDADALRPPDPLTLEAVLLHSNQALTWRRGLDDPREPVAVAPPRGWLIEPDPALIRAGLVDDFARRFQASKLDDTIAYVTADDAPQTAWARAWCVIDWLPFNLKALRDVLRARGVGGVTVKKRGTAVTPETLIPQLKLRGNARLTLVLTRHAGRQIVLLCEEQPHQPHPLAPFP